MDLRDDDSDKDTLLNDTRSLLYQLYYPVWDEPVGDVYKQDSDELEYLFDPVRHKEEDQRQQFETTEKASDDEKKETIGVTGEKDILVGKIEKEDPNMNKGQLPVAFYSSDERRKNMLQIAKLNKEVQTLLEMNSLRCPLADKVCKKEKAVLEAKLSKGKKQLKDFMKRLRDKEVVSQSSLANKDKQVERSGDLKDLRQSILPTKTTQDETSKETQINNYKSNKVLKEKLSEITRLKRRITQLEADNTKLRDGRSIDPDDGLSEPSAQERRRIMKYTIGSQILPDGLKEITSQVDSISYKILDSNVDIHSRLEDITNKNYVLQRIVQDLTDKIRRIHDEMTTNKMGSGLEELESDRIMFDKERRHAAELDSERGKRIEHETLAIKLSQEVLLLKRSLLQMKEAICEYKALGADVMSDLERILRDHESKDGTDDALQGIESVGILRGLVKRLLKDGKSISDRVTATIVSLKECEVPPARDYDKDNLLEQVSKVKAMVRREIQDRMKEKLKILKLQELVFVLSKEIETPSHKHLEVTPGRLVTCVEDCREQIREMVESIETSLKHLEEAGYCNAT